MREFTFTGFEESAKKYGSNVALIYLGEKFTYAQLKRLIDKCASGLFKLGVKPDDRVMLYLPNTPQWVIANYAINKIGACVVPVSPIYTAYEIEYMIKDAGIETVICLDTNFVYVKEVMERTNIKRVLVTTLVDFVPFWKKAIGYLFNKIPSGKVERSERVYSLKRVILEGENDPPKVAIDPDKDLAYIMYTGGTTGFPKGVPGNHTGEVTYVRNIMEEVLRGYIDEGRDRILMVNPLFHIMAKGFAIAFGFNFGNTVVLMPFPEIDPILKAIERYKIRWMLGVPALYRMILENDRLDQYDLSSLKYCFCGGDVLPVEVFRKWREKYGIFIYQVYGSTEAGHVTYSRLDKEPKPTVVGTPLSSRKCVVVDSETLEKLPSGEVGELLVTSPYTIKEYLNKPEETRRSYVTLNGEIYYRMGDYVRMNEDGEIEFVERTADIIKYKGYRVSASEVEAVLQDHPTVIGACVVGVPDPKVGERIKAIVVLKEDAKGIGSAELIKWCRERLAPYKVPQYIEFRDMLPKSKVGKLLRREIRDEERRKMEKEKRKKSA
ncbi:MAG: AMP-binding protein [Desulfobacterota bacterium]|nr:AMP-binding protein [Thermodesulfobacteriota bacterium]MDW8001994.1 AMP-binding protein [Deltaproteobacteria bacterium]